MKLLASRLVRVALLPLLFLLFSASSSCLSAPKSEPGPLVVGQGNQAAPTNAAPESAAYAPEDDAAVPIGSDDAVLGHRLAPVTIVVFSDFQCPFCSKLDLTLSALREEYGEDRLRIVFKNSPLPFHQHARLAAEVGQGVLALAGQEAFWRYAMMAFRRQPNMSAEMIRAWAIAAGGVDVERQLEEGIESKRWSAKIEKDVALASRLKANGTPVSFVNGLMITGAQEITRFKEAIAVEMEKAKALAESGVAREAIYTRLAGGNFNPRSEEEEAIAAALAESRIIHKVPVTALQPIRGPAQGAQVTIVMFADFECPFCKRGEQTLTRIRADYGDKVRFVWRDMPLSNHLRAEPAAELARAARAQKGDAAFWTVHDLLFDAQPNLGEAELERIAKEAKLDVPKAMAAVKARQWKRQIEDDIEVGDDFDAAGAPHFFINGRRVAGAKAYETIFKPIIDEEVKKADALLMGGGGTSLKNLYDELTKTGKLPLPFEKKTIGQSKAATSAPFRGTANAKIIVQEVADFQCPFCKRSELSMEQLLKDYPGKIKIVWRDKPLPRHTDAPLAAEAAREAFVQKGSEGFQKMQKLLLDNQTALKRDDLDGYAKLVGLDMTKFAAALDTHTHKAAVDHDAQAADDAGVSGTPAFFVGPYFISGAQPYSRFRKAVELILNPPPAAVTTSRLSALVAAGAVAASMPPGLIVKDVAVGTSGAPVKAGDKIKVHYTGTFTNGTEFDSSRTHGQPFTFEVGRGAVIKGWDAGLIGMKVGGKRKLTIPPDLAYGDRGAPPKIPPKSTLVFDVELVAIE